MVSSSPLLLPGFMNLLARFRRVQQARFCLLRAEDAVAGVAETGDYVGVLV